MTLFWILWAIDAVVALIALYYFFIGLQDGSVASFNMTMWLGMLIALAAVLGGGLLLKSIGKLALAKILLSVLAIPALLFGLFMLVVIMSGEKWN